jgi:glycosyltransferase involved in cell wall biosynthesis
VVASESGGLPDIVRPGENGALLRSVDDPEPWRAAIAAITGDPDRRAAYGATGRAQMLALVSPRAVAERYRNVNESARRGIVRAR